jgi:hypothetical protein
MALLRAVALEDRFRHARVALTYHKSENVSIDAILLGGENGLPGARYAEMTLNSIGSSEHEIVQCWWLNSSMRAEWQQIFDRRGHTHVNDRNNVSRAWNRSINHLLAEGCKYVFVPNLDIVVRSGSIDALVAAAERNPEPILWTMANWHALSEQADLPGLEQAPVPDNFVEHPHFSAYMVDARLFEKVGPFDEHFEPAYNEDLDMHWRIKRAGERAVQYEGARFYHYGSRTIGEDPSLFGANLITHSKNNEYFVEKWKKKPPTADDPFTDGMFMYPFDDPEKVGIEREAMSTW